MTAADGDSLGVDDSQPLLLFDFGPTPLCE
jgi:hypothetical protein